MHRCQQWWGHAESAVPRGPAAPLEIVLDVEFEVVFLDEGVLLGGGEVGPEFSACAGSVPGFAKIIDSLQQYGQVELGVRTVDCTQFLRCVNPLPDRYVVRQTHGGFGLNPTASVPEGDLSETKAVHADLGAGRF